ncbi:hypothetical protein C6P40_000566 [Pichia californica]|uniref:Uncharacterized protein n=1 Tax=Pichia californica TaxID=460514 RepID=A0A9P7BGW3_9ASCO|nr:hypothetical protein C6P42_000514 [[Candida] californica]KAG0688758.1 hypothetical protein C6P40_000566 [[Candida] californica]
MSGRAPDNKSYGGNYGNNNNYNSGNSANYNNRNSYGNYNSNISNSYNSRKSPFGSNNNYNNINDANNYGSYNNTTTTTNNNTVVSVETPEQFADPNSISRRETEMRNDMDEVNEMLSLSNHIFTSYSLKPPVQVNILPNRDYSYEEDRIQYYAARISNSIPQYQQQISNRHTDMLESTKFLKLNTQKAVRYLQLTVQNPNAAVKPLIPPVDINAPPRSNNSNSIFGNVGSEGNPFNQKSNPFGGSSNVFGSSNNGGNLGAFGNQNINSSPFSSQQTNSTTTTSSPFGQSGFANTQSTTFGSSGFGGTTATATNPFGASSFNSLTNKPANPFGATAPAPSNNMSTQNTSPFGNSGFSQSGFSQSGFGTSSTNTSNPFGNSSNSSSSNPFGTSSNTTSNPFGGSTTNTTSNPFGGSTTNNTASSFGNTNNSAGGIFSSTNAFQNNNQNSVPSQSSPFGGSQNSGSGYKQCDIGNEQTKLEDVRGEILQMFKANEFQLGKIPDIPPPIELC